MDRDFHEVIGNIIKIEDRPQEAQIANSYAIRTNYTTDELVGIDPDLVEVKITSGKHKLSADSLDKALNGVDYSYPEETKKLSLLKQKAIDEKDYMFIFNHLRDTYPFNQIDEYILYQHSRNMVGRPMTTTEKFKVKADLNAIKKYWKKEAKKMKKKQGVYKIDF